MITNAIANVITNASTIAITSAITNAITIAITNAITKWIWVQGGSARENSKMLLKGVIRKWIWAKNEFLGPVKSEAYRIIDIIYYSESKYQFLSRHFLLYYIYTYVYIYILQ